VPGPSETPEKKVKSPPVLVPGTTIALVRKTDAPDPIEVDKYAVTVPVFPLALNTLALMLTTAETVCDQWVTAASTLGTFEIQTPPMLGTVWISTWACRGAPASRRKASPARTLRGLNTRDVQAS
jgi:hypothetical protein